MLKLNEETKVPENLEFGYSRQKYGILSNEDICNTFENLPDLENSMQEDTKMTLTYIAGYICRKPMKRMVVFAKPLIEERQQFLLV